MSILINKKTQVLVQGITGKEGSRATSDMLSYGTKVVGGITPGKGGTKEISNLPVWNTVAEAIKIHPKIDVSLIAVPAAFVENATREALSAGIPLIVILSEKVPVLTVAKLIQLARLKKARIVGPSSVGIISPGKAKIGAIGGGGLDKRVFSPGNIGVISKSGGMTSEISYCLTKAGFGQSTALGIGGDMLLGSDFTDIALLFEKDPETKALVIFGEIGGTYEEQLADAIKNKLITKPVVALIAGEFSKTLMTGTILGHAGAIVGHGRGSFDSKVKSLKDAGAIIVSTPEEIPKHLTKLLK